MKTIIVTYGGFNYTCDGASIAFDGIYQLAKVSDTKPAAIKAGSALPETWSWFSFAENVKAIKPGWQISFEVHFEDGSYAKVMVMQTINMTSILPAHHKSDNEE